MHDQTHLHPELVDVILFDIDSINEHCTKLWVIKAHDEADECRFARTRFTNNSDGLIVLNFQIQSLENPLLEA